MHDFSPLSESSIHALMGESLAKQEMRQQIQERINHSIYLGPEMVENGVEGHKPRFRLGKLIKKQKDSEIYEVTDRLLKTDRLAQVILSKDIHDPVAEEQIITKADTLLQLIRPGLEDFFDFFIDEKFGPVLVVNKNNRNILENPPKLPRNFIGELYVDDEGEVNKRYKVGSIIAQGGMSFIRTVDDRKIPKHDLVMKCLQKWRELPQDKIENALNEAKIMGGVAHPGVIKVLDAFSDENFGPVFIMERETSPTLAKEIKSKVAFSPQEIIRIFQELMETLQVFYEKGIIHRDIKPSQIFLNPNFVKLADFGVGFSGSESEINKEEVFGWPTYLAPEIMLGDFSSSEGLVRRETLANFYTFGVIIYEIITNEELFEFKLRQDIPKIDQVLINLQKKEKYIFSLEKNPKIVAFAEKYHLDKKKLETFFQTCLQFKPEQRYHNFPDFNTHFVEAFTPVKDTPVEEKKKKSIWTKMKNYLSGTPLPSA